MSFDDMPIRRRTVLKATGGALGTLSAVGGASAAPDGFERVNVGYGRPSGHDAAVAAAEKVIYEFGFDALTVVVPESAAGALAARPDVRYVEEDAPVYALKQSLPWGVDRVDADVAHRVDSPRDDDGEPETGDGAHVAIIDTGIDMTHTDLDDNLGEGRAFTGGVEHSDWQDDNGHGTHCAGIADAEDNTHGVVGVSTEATLHAVKVLSAAGTGLTSDVARGVEWAADQGYDVGSLSLGGGDNDALREACEYAYHDRGMLLVAAAGNDGPCADCVTFPAQYDECLAVSATTCSDGLAEFSSTGPEVELAAPGDSVYSTYIPNDYTTLSGTSMACPHVSGAGGQLMAHGLTNVEARQRLRDTAENVGLGSNEQGHGLLDVAAALDLDSSDDGLGNGPNC